MLCCLAVLDQAPVMNDLCFDLLPFCQDWRAAHEVDVDGCQVAEAFVIPATVVVLDEDGDRCLEFVLQGVVFEPCEAGKYLIR